ncbi:MAG: 3-deoxy-8-phosphooctulonate synthase [SAR86 cluster bacterium]|nr:3-deoxy-8-phosphooctulonate synthase [SAR86 cluster bacterium]
MKNIIIGQNKVSNDKPFTLIAGLNVLESESIADQVVDHCVSVTRELGIPFVFKASYDKANRSSLESFRGPGLEEGLKILSDIKDKYSVPIISDVHTVGEVQVAKDVLDIIQIPAFLCRQTDLIKSAAETGLPVNIKKGQFLSPLDFQNIINKFTSFQNDKLLICERGTSFGYNNLIVDMIGISTLKKFEYPVIFDVTHSLQQPGSLGGKSGGRASSALDLAKAAMSIGLAGLFLELHPNPEQALCDGPSALPLELLKPFLKQIMAIDSVVKGLPVMKI